MDLAVIEPIVLAVGAAIATVVWWLFRSLHAKVDQTDRSANLAADNAKDELAKFKLHCAETYVTNTALTSSIETMNRAIDAIFKKLERIDEKLDRKADKP